MLSKEQVIEQCMSFYKKTNRLPRQKDFSCIDGVNQHVVKKYFNSMKRLYQAMGVDKDIRRRTKLSLIASGRNFKSGNGRYPTRRDINRANGFRHGDKTVVKLFGSWDAYLDSIEYADHTKFTPVGKRRRRNMSERIFLDWLRNQRYEKNGCWIWTKNTNSGGYGLVIYQGKYHLVHRLSYSMLIGNIPNDMVIRHICDNPACYNPEHLMIGTHSDNRKDHTKRNPINSRKSSVVKKPAGIWGDDLYLWALSVCTEKDGCMLYPSSRKYPVVFHKGKSYRMGRLLYSINHSMEYSGNWIARHTCHNPKCINPQHIVSGTRSDNAIDSREKSSVSRISMNIAREIRKEWLNSSTKPTTFDKQWATILGVSVSTIASIRHNRIWKE